MMTQNPFDLDSPMRDERCDPMPLCDVRTVVVHFSRGTYGYLAHRDEAERCFDRDIARAIKACKRTEGEF